MSFVVCKPSHHTQTFKLWKSPAIEKLEQDVFNNISKNNNNFEKFSFTVQEMPLEFFFLKRLPKGCGLTGPIGYCPCPPKDPPPIEEKRLCVRVTTPTVCLTEELKARLVEFQEKLSLGPDGQEYEAFKFFNYDKIPWEHTSVTMMKPGVRELVASHKKFQPAFELEDLWKSKDSWSENYDCQCRKEEREERESELQDLYVEHHYFSKRVEIQDIERPEDIIKIDYHNYNFDDKNFACISLTLWNNDIEKVSQDFIHLLDFILANVKK